MRLSVTIKFGPKDEYNLQCNLIGMKENQFLLLDLNQKSVEDLITRKTNNIGVVIRGITDTQLGHIIAFKSKIITVTSRPTWLMFIRLPYNFESKPIRTDMRYKINVPTQVNFNDNSVKATLCDLSKSGCGIHFNSAVEIEKESSLTIKPSLEHFPDTIPECEVVNTRRLTNGTFVGVRFAEHIAIEDDFRYEVLELAMNKLG